MFHRSTLLVLMVLAASICSAAQIDFLLSGVPEAIGGSVYSYEAGTNTPKGIYSDADLATEYDNPAALDSSGRIVAYGTGSYKFIIKNRFGVTAFTVDNYDTDFSGSATNPFGTTLTQTEIESEFINATELNVASLSVTSELNMNLGKIVELASGTGPLHAVNLGQVESLISDADPENLMKIDGSNASAVVTLQSLVVDSLDVQDSKITNVATGTSDTDAVNYGQLRTTVVEGVTDHAALNNLSYETSGHTGFAKEAGDVTKNFSVLSLTLPNGTITRKSQIATTTPDIPQDGDIWVASD